MSRWDPRRSRRVRVELSAGGDEPQPVPSSGKGGTPGERDDAAFWGGVEGKGTLEAEWNEEVLADDNSSASSL